MSETEQPPKTETQPDPFRPQTADKVIRYHEALKDHLEGKQTKYTVKVRKHIGKKLADQTEFNEQVTSLKKAFTPVVIALAVFMIIIYLILPQYMVPSLLMFPLFMLCSFLIINARRKKKEAQKLLPPPPPPPPSMPAVPLPQTTPKPKMPKTKGPRAERLGSETLTGVLLAMSTFLCFVFYFLNRSVFLPFFIILLAFYSAYLVKVRMSAHAKQTLNVPEAEQLILAMKNQKCYKCGSTEKDVSGKIEDNDVELVCKGCGTVTSWKPGKNAKKDGKKP